MQGAIAASEYGSTTLIGEDTDLLVLLLYYMKPDNTSLFFRSDKTSTNQIRVYNINKLKLLLGKPLSSHLLFIHAFTGCDTTSRIFVVGKKALFQKFVKGDTHIESCALCITNHGETCDAIEQNGYKANVLLFSGKPTDNLASLRHSVLKKEGYFSNKLCDSRMAPPYCVGNKIALIEILLPNHYMVL